MNKLLKPLVFLVVMILVCSVIVRVSNSSRTLEEYALENPEIAYATPQKTDEPVAEPSAASVAEQAESPAEDAAEDTAEDVTAVPATPDTAEQAETPNEVPSAAPSEEPAESPVTVPDEAIYYEKGFFYCPIPDAVKEKITGVSYPATDSFISYDDLYYMQVLYYDFNGEVQTGELICNRSLAPDFAEIFYELYRNEYQIEKIRLIDEYGGDDTASMLDNNTSCFNYRVVDGSTSLSKHAMGCAIDINPFYNPYVVFNKDGSGETYISPAGSEIYADRSKDFPYKIDENDLCYKLFKEHGFTWGGNWNSCKDYQHFQKVVE